MGGLIGGVVGLIIVGIMALVRQSKADKHKRAMAVAVTSGGAEGRKAIDQRLPARRRLFTDKDSEDVAERFAALAALGETDAIATEMAALEGPPMIVANARVLGRVAVASAGRNPGAELAAFDAEHAALAASAANKLSLRALAAWRPVLAALAGKNTPTPSERAELERFQPNQTIRLIIEKAIGSGTNPA